MAQPWQFYAPDPALPVGLNNLQKLEFGRGYWITVTQPITLYVKGSGGEIRLAEPRQPAHTPPAPPATLFGPLVANAGLPAQAWIDGRLCGSGQSWRQDGATIYGVHVADSSQMAGCGEVGRSVELRIGEAVAEPAWQWTASGLHRFPVSLSANRRLFLPSVSNTKP